MGSKGLQQAYNKTKGSTTVGEASGKLRFAQELENGQSLLLLFVKPAKNQQAIKINVPKNTLKVLRVTPLITEKRLN